MRVLVCPDSFGGTLSAGEAAAAVVDGWLSVRPGDELVARPLSDGGPGFLDVISAAVGGRRIGVPTTDPLGRGVPAEVLIVERGDYSGPAASAAAARPGAVDAYLESAQACGLHLVGEQERDPMVTTSYGLGALLCAAVGAGARTVVVGLGGSGTNDGGAGLLAALRAPALDSAGYPLPPGGAALVGCTRLAGPPRLPALDLVELDLPAIDLAEVDLVVATDVDNPLTGASGASAVYGPQKGAGPAEVRLLDAALAHFAQVCERDIPGCPPGLAGLPGAGAAGGLGAALLALGGRRESGIGLVRRLSWFDVELDRADLVITGEGSFDDQSLRGKVVAGVAAAARDRGKPCLVLAGQVSVEPGTATRAGVRGAYALPDQLGSVAEALRRPGEGLRALAAHLASQQSAAAAGE